MNDRVACDPRRPVGRSAFTRSQPVFLLTVAFLVVALPGRVQAQEERGMIDAVLRTFDVAGRQVYFVPRFLEDGSETNQMGAVVRPAPQTIAEIERTYRAKVMTPEEAIRCPDEGRPETCTIPNHGIIFYFVQLRPPRPDGTLQVRLLVYHDGRGEGGQILREGWEFTMRRTAGVGWRVVNRQLVATVQGPGL